MACRHHALAALLPAAALALAVAMPAAGLPSLKKIKDDTKKAVKAVVGSEADSSGQSAPAAAPAGAGAAAVASPAAKPGEGTWLNYDFVPGDKVLFFDDFTTDPVGNFPHRLELVTGNMEIAEWQGRRLLRATSWYAEFKVPLPGPLPPRFTVEFELAGPGGRGIFVTCNPAGSQDEDYSEVQWGAGVVEVRGEKGGTSRVNFDRDLADKLFFCRMMGDGKYLKVYTNETRYANLPNAAFGHGDQLRFVLQATDDYPMFVGPIRIAEGGRIQLYDKLASEGRVATQGILFDTGSDRIRPESTPTLTDIAQMLTLHADLKLRIEGHTDNVGDAAANQALSEKRAAAVKAYLVGKHQVDAARLETAGLGASKPVAPNDTPEGRQTNRRVELVKL
jgi:outer membrane protein OmpA-like peptidoglycan-associated protein